MRNLLKVYKMSKEEINNRDMRILMVAKEKSKSRQNTGIELCREKNYVFPIKFMFSVLRCTLNSTLLFSFYLTNILCDYWHYELCFYYLCLICDLLHQCIFDSVIHTFSISSFICLSKAFCF